MKHITAFILICAMSLISTFAIAAENITFRIMFDGTMTDGSTIGYDAVDARIDCGLAQDGTYADWTLNIGNYNPDAVTHEVTRTVKPPQQSDYYCIATIIETATGLESAPSNVMFYDLGTAAPPPEVTVPSTPTLDGTVNQI